MRWLTILAFSNEVYGEVKPSLVRQFIDIVNLSKDDVFIDLGSGIGILLPSTQLSQDKLILRC
jgi:H3 lysine-79-specific histone-lysine N-methyltransferase